MSRRTLRKKRVTASQKIRQQYEEELQFFLMYGDHSFSREPFQTKQNGGGTVRVGDQNIVYKQDKMGNRIVIQSDRPVSAGQFILFLDGEAAILHSVSKVITPLQKENTKDLVRAAVQIATKFKASWIEVTDNSTICKEGVNVDSAVSLADYSFVTKGKTWYETIFPFTLLGDQTPINDNRNIIQLTSWKDLITYPSRQHKTKLQRMNNELPVDITNINISAPGSIMTVLSQIPYDSRCNFFQKYLKYILMAAELVSLKDTVWYYPLKEGVVHPNSVINQSESMYTIEKEE
jgi:hypothetical protein